MRWFPSSSAEPGRAPNPQDQPQTKISEIISSAIASDHVSLAHRWQDFRKACLELAIKSGASPEEAVAAAGKFHDYILGPSERETKSIEQAAKDSE